MSRDNPRRKKNQTIYSISNPPIDRAAAQARLDELTRDIEQIQTQLDNLEEQDFENQTAHRHWRYRAISAKANKSQEAKFLAGWLSPSSRPPALTESPRPRPSAHLPAIAERIRNQARELAAAINYTPIYTEDHEPPDLLTAHNRKDALTATKQHLVAAFTEVTSAWTAHPLRREDLSGVKAPLQAILVQVEAELSVIRQYLRRENHIFPQDWSIVLQALDRADGEGFPLTFDERQATERLRHAVANQNLAGGR